MHNARTWHAVPTFNVEQMVSLMVCSANQEMYTKTTRHLHVTIQEQSAQFVQTQSQTKSNKLVLQMKDVTKVNANQ
jgi:hypothetical protein